MQDCLGRRGLRSLCLIHFLATVHAKQSQMTRNRKINDASFDFRFSIWGIDSIHSHQHLSIVRRRELLFFSTHSRNPSCSPQLYCSNQFHQIQNQKLRPPHPQRSPEAPNPSFSSAFFFSMVGLHHEMMITSLTIHNHSSNKLYLSSLQRSVSTKGL